MALSLHTIRAKPGTRRIKKRRGRGNASGLGTYSGRGQKGQRARTGGGNGLYLKGMRNLIRQTPKTRGFKSLAPRPQIVQIARLAVFPKGTIITPDFLVNEGLIRHPRGIIKILGGGTVTTALIIRGCSISASAKEALEKAGGKVESKVIKSVKS